MLFIQIKRKEGPRSYKRNLNSSEKKAFKIHTGLCLYGTKTLDTSAALLCARRGQGFESRRIHFQNQRGASTLQNREITVLTCELQFNPILFSCRSKTRDLRTVASVNSRNKHVRTYSRTSRKRPPKMQRLSGRLREVIAYKNRTTGRLFRGEVQGHLTLGARDFSSAVSGFCQVFLVTRAKSLWSRALLL